MTDQPHHDRFTLPGDIPSARPREGGDLRQPETAPSGTAAANTAPADTVHANITRAHITHEGLRPPPARGLAEGRGLVDGRKADQQPTHPAGRGWVPQSRDLGIPSDHMIDDPLGAIGHSAVFTMDRRVRFLDHLAMKGNVRAAAARVGISHETAYRKRRQDAAFGALWDAAMVHARSHAESVLATRALDGVDVPVFHRGEITAWQVRHDPRLLLAHLARLDRKVAEGGPAVDRAGRFDELLAAYAGHAAPEGFAEAAEEAREWRPRSTPGLPPTREEYVAFRRGEAMDDEDEDEDAEHLAMEAAGEIAGEEWDEWHEGVVATVEAVLEGRTDYDEEEGGEEEPEAETSPLVIPADPPFVIPAKAGTQQENAPEGPLEPTPTPESKTTPANRVTSVNLTCSALAPPFIAG